MRAQKLSHSYRFQVFSRSRQTAPIALDRRVATSYLSCLISSFKIPRNNYGLNADSKLLDWVEQAALENIRAHVKCADDIKRESNTAMAIIIAGASGALAYAAKLIESPTDLPLALAAGMLSIYLFSLCAVLVFKCLTVGVFPSPTNEPKHLYQKQFSLETLREVELKNIQKRIEAAVRINDARALWLNRIWAAATASPIIFAITFFLTR
jgi:hypothetical protein